MRVFKEKLMLAKWINEKIATAKGQILGLQRWGKEAGVEQELIELACSPWHEILKELKEEKRSLTQNNNKKNKE